MKELRDEKVCLALGYFDSMHLGHRALIAAARKTANESGVGCAVATFSNNAYKQFNIDGKQVYTYAERCTLLDGLCDYVLPMRFDARLKNMPAEQFLDMLASHYDIAAAVCGYDYLFGKGAKGDAELLESYFSARGARCGRYSSRQRVFGCAVHADGQGSGRARRGAHVRYTHREHQDTVE